MPLKEPSWWYQPRPTLAATLLSPISAIYSVLANRRLRQPPQYIPRLPVICVGNFTAGGTGKTPLALRICQILLALDEQPVFLTRGFGGKAKGPLLVGPTHTADDVGDEPLLLARNATTVVSRDRAQGAKFIEAQALGTVIIMDDGLQNPALAKTLAFAVVDGGRGIGNGMTIPAGPLRAPMAEQLPRVNAIIVNSAASHDCQRALNQFAGTMFTATVEPCGELDWVKGQPLVAFAGIGNPERFFDLLRNLGADLRHTMTFNDHHPYTPQDVDRLLQCAAREQATLVTTEKDFVRLHRNDRDFSALIGSCKVLPIEMRFPEDDSLALTSMIVHAMERHRAASKAL